MTEPQLADAPSNTDKAKVTEMSPGTATNARKATQQQTSPDAGPAGSPTGSKNAQRAVKALEQGATARKLPAAQGPNGHSTNDSGNGDEDDDDEAPDASQDAGDADDTTQDTPQESTAATAKPKRSRPKRKPKVKKPTKIIKLRLSNNEPAPNFTKIEFSGPNECFWLRVQIREFLLRFDKHCRIPSRYLGALNDLTTPWPDTLYKSVIASLFRIFSYDKTWLIPLAKGFIPAIEDCPSESSELWTLLNDFLLQSDPYASNAESLTGEHYRLELIRRLLVLTAATETIRLTVISDHESLQQLKKENVEQIKHFQDQFNTKIEQAKQNKDTFADRKAQAERTTAEKIFKAEQLMYNRLRKYNLRTSAVGKDNFGNVYWILQQKSKELWGSCVLCEMRVFPDDEEAMVLETESSNTANTGKELSNTGKSKAGNASASEAPPKKRRRFVIKKRDFLSDREPSLQYVSGQDEIIALAGWIRGQIGFKQEALATDIETMAYYCATE